MALGTAIAAAATIGGAIIGSKGAKKAAKTQAQAAQESAAVQRDIYNQNAATLAPYVQAGIPATGMINALLGIPAAQPAPAASPAGDDQRLWRRPLSMRRLPGMISGFGGGTFNMDGTQATPVQQSFAPITQPTAEQAFNRYLDSTGYRFQLGEGMRALDAKFAGMGAFKSGAAVRAANNYATNMGKGYFNDYLASLGNQQALGLSAASAQAGVGQNYANSLTAINANRADAMSNAALVKASTTGNALNSLGQIGAGLFNTGGGGVNTNAMWNTSSALPGFTPSTLGAGQTNDWRTW